MGKAKKVTRRRELLVKGTHLVLRQVAMSPEMVQARRLRRSVDRHVQADGPLAGRKILIPTIRDWASHVHLEALLGHYLRSQGAVVRHLSCGGGLEICDRANSWEAPPMPCRSCSSYVKKSLRAHNATVSWLSDAWPETQWPEIDSLNLSDLLNVEFESFPLGRMVEVPVKWFLLAESLHEDPLAAQTYRAFLRAARMVLVSVMADIERNRPDQVVLLNGLFMFEAVIWEVCRRNGIPVVSYERAFIVDSVVFAHNRVSSFYEIDDVWASWRDQELSPEDSRALDEYLGDRRAGLRTSDDYWAKVERKRIDRVNSGRRAVLFTNLVWDSAVLGQDVAFGSIVDWIVAAVEKFRVLENHELIIRIHPAETKLSGRESRERMHEALARRVTNMPSNVTVIHSEDNISSYELMDDADFGLVYSSTAGLEMALAGKPVVVAAKTHYRNKGFTVDVSSPNEFDQAIETLVESRTSDPFIMELARRYAALFFFHTPYFRMGISEPMRGLVSFDSTDFSALISEERGDVSRFVEAVATGRSFNQSSAVDRQFNPSREGGS